MHTKKNLQIIRISAIFIFGFFSLFALLFWPAGTINWPEAWAFLIIQISYSGILGVYLYKYSPDLLKKRLETKMPPKLWDKLVVLPAFIDMFALFIIPGFDIIRFKWSQPFPLYIEVIGFVLLILSFIVIFLVMRENPFLKRTVEIQENQRVISTGPYRFIRHPMYTAFIVMCFSIAICLGSVYAFIPAAIRSIFMIIRTVFEDRMLKNELEGYKEYAKSTKYRLVPGLW